MEEEDEDQIALRQLWDAASQLKLDSTALNNLVARSPSNVSKNVDLVQVDDKDVAGS
jgi:hypothetical protein